MKALMLIFLMMFANFSEILSQENNDYFEGVITYLPKSVPFVKDSALPNYLEIRFGDTMKYYFSIEGDLRRKTISNQKIGIQEAFYKQKDNTQYIKYYGCDSLYYYDASINGDTKIIYEERGIGDTILNLPTKYILLNTENSKTGNYTIEYFYNSSIIIDSENYSNLKDGFADYLFKESNSPFLRLILTYEHVKLTYTAITIKDYQLAKDIFELPNLPTKIFPD